MNPPSSWADAVERRAHADADGEVIRRVGGPATSAGLLLENAVDMASSLATLIGAGDVVATACPSGPTAATLTTAISWLGAIELPIPTTLDPRVAARLMTAAGCVLVVASPDRLIVEPHSVDLSEAAGIPVVTVAGHRDGFAALSDRTGPRPARRRTSRDDPAAIMVTSGTTGRPKGALLCNGVGLGQSARVRRAMQYDSSDVLLNVFPWQHVNARHAAFLPAVESGARLVVDDFSARRFWRTARDESVTAFNFMGAVCAILLRGNESEDDRAHSISRAYGGPAPEWMCHRVTRRFGVQLRQAYASTELGDVATTGRLVKPGAAGQIVADYRVRVTGEDGSVLGDGLTGSLEVLPRRSDATFTEYVGDPESTRRAWRDGWFVTGDRGRLVDGWLHYEGRCADTIRRRGLTIDAEHVERVASVHPDVAHAAAVGVPSELTEDEVLLAVVPHVGRTIRPGELLRHCARELPRHAVPRYITVEKHLPTSAGTKLDRRALRDRGLPAAAWDAEDPHHDQE
ncbi:AMP-binding protein [Rhodococcus sp. BP-349]|uniref:AMP-binding protein n=1 Tax=unclassified Rhodococcus (in: high G+C Gram-positive bacteria) TaxID=192944 RepID=UPI001C9B0016|nr:MULTISPECIES: AMP-binding protein [unclassified Rhodococcus (in: high G+C Gram-positive bacteria)]MBY6537940.1 AMP-binding protein [Rhodococcus sp. BP-363]MBY6542277.1 AMP-binding protein [Rhodococcus sp. BP-369]MBY6561507.1 AMP-binding protein [Rhodococcus sp. BP-370]MBY6575799.1 AMP-binding protein [Rhodococcus sp. BP-364]MBY6585100.1 AMP-binding protein [Rhodococcus sp. BP-358]